MAIKENNWQSTAAKAAAKASAKRRSEAVRRFVDENVKGTDEITPKWQRAIDNYNRMRGDKDSQ